MKNELVFLGPPASGKGTQTARLSELLKLPHVDTGGLLRAAIKNQTPDGITAKSYIDKGQLVPLDIVASIIKTRLSEDDCKDGFILDGFPRSVEQAQKLEQILTEIDTEPTNFSVLYFDINQDLLLDRIIYRRSCPACGKIYNLKSLPPKVEGQCDCGADELIQRKDDTKEIASARFETYFKETAPVVEYYKNKNVLKTIDANGEVEEVWERLLDKIK